MTFGLTMQPELANKLYSLSLGLIATIAFPIATAFAGVECNDQNNVSSVSIAAFRTPPAPKQASQQQQPAAQPKTKPQEGEWRVISPSDAMATFRMPKKPRYIERTFTPVANKPPIKVHLHIATVNDGKATYIFGYNDLHEAPADARTLDRALEGAVRGSVVNVQGKLLSEVTKIRFKNSMGRQFNYRYFQSEKPYVVLSRVFIVGKRQYQISAVSLESEHNEALAAEYLNSFKLLTVENDEPPVPRVRK